MAETKEPAEGAAPSNDNEKMWLALLLAWIAGFADAFGFLALKEIFFSAVSGNTVAVNASLAKKDWAEAAHRGCPIVCFVGGLIVGSILEKLAGRLQIRRRFGIALAIEAALLLAFAILGQQFSSSNGGLRPESIRFYSLIALLSGAMGIQTATLRRVRQQSVSTPFVTGMLVQAVENTINALFNTYDRLAKREPEFPNDSWSRAAFHGAIWLSFAIGAVFGGLGEISWGYPALFAPVTLLAFVMICDLVRPICD